MQTYFTSQETIFGVYDFPENNTDSPLYLLIYSEYYMSI